MRSQAFLSGLIRAALLIPSAQASPFEALDIRDFSLSRRDTFVSHQCYELVVGATRSPDIGTVCADLMDSTLTITYIITTAGWTFNAVHAWVGTSTPTSNTPGTAPGKFPYTSNNGFCTISGSVATCTVSEIPDSWRSCTGQLDIVAHADVAGPTGIQQTAWDNGQCYPDTKGNCAKYFTVKEQCECPIVYSYSPIVTSTTFPVTVITTTTVYCTTTPSPLLTTTSCNDPNAPTITSTISTTTSVDLVCPSPSS